MTTEVGSYSTDEDDVIESEWTSSNTYTSSTGTTIHSKYTVRVRQQHYERCTDDAPCKLVVATFDDVEPLEIPCFHCDRNEFSNANRYSEAHRYVFSTTIRQYFPGMLLAFAEEVSNHVKSTLESANAMHGRSCVDRKNVTIVHYVDVLLDVIPVYYGEYGDSLSLDLTDEMLANELCKPATEDSVQGLLSKKLDLESSEGDRYEIGWSPQKCVICLDEILTRKSSLVMDCSHVFHEDCLVPWLYVSHFCPLCRHQMPTDHE